MIVILLIVLVYHLREDHNWVSNKEVSNVLCQELINT